MSMDVSRLITPSKYHRTLNGIELVKAREALGLTQAEFAEKCEWTASFQCRIESLGEHEVHIDLVNKILAVLRQNPEKS